MNEYLAFVDFIGTNNDGSYIYRFDFTIDTDSVWGEYFNIQPSGYVPNIQPDINCITTRSKVLFPREMALAKTSYCFSMQDCIDGIIPLCFSEIDDETVEYEDAPILFNFGEDRTDVENKLKSVGCSFYETETIEHGNSNAVDALLNDL